MKKFNDVSLVLRNKIRRDLKVIDSSPEIAYYYGVIQFDESEIELFQECLQWLETIKSFFKVSRDCFRMTRIGRFIGIRPVRILSLTIKKMEVEFSIEDCEPSSWRDWFDVNGKNDGELLGVLGTVINKRTHPDYAS